MGKEKYQERPRQILPPMQEQPDKDSLRMELLNQVMRALAQTKRDHLLLSADNNIYNMNERLVEMHDDMRESARNGTSGIFRGRLAPAYHPLQKDRLKGRNFAIWDSKDIKAGDYGKEWVGTEMKREDKIITQQLKELRNKYVKGELSFDEYMSQTKAIKSTISTTMKGCSSGNCVMPKSGGATLAMREGAHLYNTNALTTVGDLNRNIFYPSSLGLNYDEIRDRAVAARANNDGETFELHGQTWNAADFANQYNLQGDYVDNQLIGVDDNLSPNHWYNRSGKKNLDGSNISSGYKGIASVLFPKDKDAKAYYEAADKGMRGADLLKFGLDRGMIREMVIGGLGKYGKFINPGNYFTGNRADPIRGDQDEGYRTDNDFGDYLGQFFINAHEGGHQHQAITNHEYDNGYDMAPNEIAANAVAYKRLFANTLFRDENGKPTPIDTGTPFIAETPEDFDNAVHVFKQLDTHRSDISSDSLYFNTRNGYPLNASPVYIEKLKANNANRFKLPEVYPGQNNIIRLLMKYVADANSKQNMYGINNINKTMWS